LALLRDAAENDGLPIMVGYNLRFHGAVIRAKQWLDEGRIGTPPLGALLLRPAQ
jgi:predicted dehydrogenase